MSENLILGIFLALAGGFLDAYTYLVRGGVFANAQTGNIVLLGINIVNGDFSSAIRYVIPIVAFALGVLVVEILKKRFKEIKLIHWRQIIVLAEIVLLFAAPFVPVGRFDIVVNTIVSFVCAMQVECFRVISGSKVATTMCTGNLRSGTEMLFNGIVTKNIRNILTSMTYYLIIVSFILGAVAGAYLTDAFSVKSIWAVCILLVGPFVMMFKES